MRRYLKIYIFGLVFLLHSSLGDFETHSITKVTLSEKFPLMREKLNEQNNLFLVKNNGYRINDKTHNVLY